MKTIKKQNLTPSKMTLSFNKNDGVVLDIAGTGELKISGLTCAWNDEGRNV